MDIELQMIRAEIFGALVEIVESLPKSEQPAALELVAALQRMFMSLDYVADDEESIRKRRS